jgi:hypothetical protein
MSGWAIFGLGAVFGALLGVVFMSIMAMTKP